MMLKALSLKRKFQAVTILALIHIGGISVLWVLGLIALIGSGVARLCNRETGLELLKDNCNVDELKNFVKGYMILN